MPVTTDLPSARALDQHKAHNFADVKDISDRIALLKAFRREGNLLDFGCSWGYHTWQLRSAGYDVTGYDISVPRARYARDKLGLHIIDNEEVLCEGTQAFDVIFSSHVLEHVNSIDRVFTLLDSLLKPSGIMLIFVPNGDHEYECKLGRKNFDMRWGENTPHIFSGEFLQERFTHLGYTTLVAGYDYMKPPNAESIRSQFANVILRPLDADEIVVIAQKRSAG